MKEDTMVRAVKFVSWSVWGLILSMIEPLAWGVALDDGKSPWLVYKNSPPDGNYYYLSCEYQRLASGSTLFRLNGLMLFDAVESRQAGVFHSGYFSLGYA
jgi:hypothetical protein